MAIGRTGLLTAVESVTSVMPDAGRDEDNRFAAALHEAETEKARLEYLRQLTPQVSEILRSWGAEKKHLAPADVWERRRQLVARRRAEAHRRATSGLPMSASDEMAFRRDTRQQSLDLLVDVDRERLTKLREERVRDLRRLVHGSAPELPRVKVLREEQVPPHILNRTHNPPFTVVPPYPANWHTFFHWFSSGTSEVTNDWTNPSTGQVGHRTVYKNFDADDNDYCNTEAKSLVGFNVPAQGSQKKWKFIIKTRCSRARAQFTWWDEWGSSYTDNTMYSNLRIAISTEPPTNLLSHPFERALIWKQWWHGDDDFDHFFELLPPGTQQWFEWTTPFTLPNKSAFVTVGTADYTDYHLDDVSVHNIMNNRWFIDQVSIELV